MKGTKVLELGQIAGLNDAGEGAASGAQDPRTHHGPEGTEAGLGEARLESEQEWSKGMDQQIGHQPPHLSLDTMKDRNAKKNLPLPLTFHQKAEVHRRDL